MADSITTVIQNQLKQSVHDLYNIEINSADIHLEHPANDDFGDWATNLALTLTKELKLPPRQIAESISANISNLIEQSQIAKVAVAGPGFINFTLQSSYYKGILDEVNEDYGKSDIGKGMQVMVEFGQPNTHKEFHVGHLKSAISGLAIAGLQQALGYEVIKANYFGDVGMQAAKSTWGFMQRGEPADFATWDIYQKMRYVDDSYVYGAAKFKEDPNAESEIRNLNKEIYQDVDTENVRVYRKLRAISIEHQNVVFKELGIVYDRQYPESEVDDEGIKIVKENVGKVFEQSEGAIIFRGEKEGLTNWVFITSEGNPTYSAKDLGLADLKFKEYPSLQKALVMTSVEQSDYFKAVISAFEKIFPQYVGKFHHLPFGWLLFNGKKLSSRTGGVPKGLDVLEEVKVIAKQKISVDKNYAEAEMQDIISKVALAGLRFLILSHELHKDINYDPDKFITLEGFSGPYILYSYARARSILKQVTTELPTIDKEQVLNSSEELSVLKYLARFPEAVVESGSEFAPHILCNYLYELAQRFNKFYKEHSVLTAETEQDKYARLQLTQAIATVLRSGLNMLGIETIERM